MCRASLIIPAQKDEKTHEKRVEIITALKFAQVCQTSRKSSKGASKVCKLQQIVKMWLLPLLITIYTRAIQIAGSWIFKIFSLEQSPAESQLVKNVKLLFPCA